MWVGKEDLLHQCATDFGTPCYIYLEEKILSQCHSLKNAFGSSRSVDFCFAVKANSTSKILSTIFECGFGADVVSGGELDLAVRCGANPSKTVFSGVGKQDWEIELGIKNRVRFNVESPWELERIESLAKRQKTTVEVLLRVNPGLPIDTHPYVATGLYSSKFGIPETDLDESVRLARSLSSLKLVGLGCHLGSQLSDLELFGNATRRLRTLASGLQEGHPEFDRLDLGGGLAAKYSIETPPTSSEYAKTLLTALSGSSFKLVLEPGRWLVAESGALLTRVLGVKTTPEKRFVVVDAGMNDLIRPCLYEAYHPIEAVSPRDGAAQTCDIVGPLCETGDFLGLSRILPPVKTGDLLWVGVAGAYGSSMASNYNFRPRAAEILAQNRSLTLIRRRETLGELSARDLM
jgi:diaminopimelate decarboxylase